MPHAIIVPSAAPTTSISAALSSSSSPSLHGTSKEAAAIGAPIAALSFTIVVLIASLIRYKRRSLSTKATPQSQVANENGSVERIAEQKRLEMPTNIVSREMEARTKHLEVPGDVAATELESHIKRSELVA